MTYIKPTEETMCGVVASNGYIIEGPVKCYTVADKSLTRPGRKQATATQDFDVHISYL